MAGEPRARSSQALKHVKRLQAAGEDVEQRLAQRTQTVRGDSSPHRERAVACNQIRVPMRDIETVWLDLAGRHRVPSLCRRLFQ